MYSPDLHLAAHHFTQHGSKWLDEERSVDKKFTIDMAATDRIGVHGSCNESKLSLSHSPIETFD